jgi:hypothetical protein
MHVNLPLESLSIRKMYQNPLGFNSFKDLCSMYIETDGRKRICFVCITITTESRKLGKILLLIADKHQFDDLCYCVCISTHAYLFCVHQYSTFLPWPANAALLDDREYTGRGAAKIRKRSPAMLSCGQDLYSTFLNMFINTKA